jgi:hypothetical protein
MLDNPSLDIVVVHDTRGPYGSLTQAQARVVEAAFQEQLTAVFDDELRESWTDLNANSFDGKKVKSLSRNNESLGAPNVADAINELLGGLSVGGQQLNVKSESFFMVRLCVIHGDVHTDRLRAPLLAGPKLWHLQADVDGICITASAQLELKFEVATFGGGD